MRSSFVDNLLLMSDVDWHREMATPSTDTPHIPLGTVPEGETGGTAISGPYCRPPRLSRNGIHSNSRIKATKIEYHALGGFLSASKNAWCWTPLATASVAVKARIEELDNDIGCLERVYDLTDHHGASRVTSMTTWPKRCALIAATAQHLRPAYWWPEYGFRRRTPCCWLLRVYDDGDIDHVVLK